MTDFSKLRTLTPEEVAAIPSEQPDPDYIRRNTIWQGPSSIYAEIDQRRQKQIAKGYDAAHDDQHSKGEIALGAAAYCEAAARSDVYVRIGRASAFPLRWPWKPSEFKSEGPRENLLKAAAMIVAEIERLDRKK